MSSAVVLYLVSRVRTHRKGRGGERFRNRKKSHERAISLFAVAGGADNDHFVLFSIVTWFRSKCQHFARDATPKRVKLESSEKECRLAGCDKADFSALSSRSGLQLFDSKFAGGGQATFAHFPCAPIHPTARPIHHIKNWKLTEISLQCMTHARTPRVTLRLCNGHAPSNNKMRGFVRKGKLGELGPNPRARVMATLRRKERVR